jgi:hypothetical protein
MNELHAACKQAVQLIKNKLNNGKRYSLQIMVDDTSQYYLRRKRIEEQEEATKVNDVHDCRGKRKRRANGR